MMVGCAQRLPGQATVCLITGSLWLTFRLGDALPLLATARLTVADGSSTESDGETRGRGNPDMSRCTTAASRLKGHTVNCTWVKVCDASHRMYV